MTWPTDKWIKIHSLEIDLSKLEKLAYDEEDIMNQQKEGCFFKYTMLDQLRKNC